MPTGKGAKRKNQSICDKLVRMAVNLVIIAKKTLGSPSGRTAGDAPIKASPTLPPQDPTTAILRVEPGSHSKAYVAEPDDLDRQAADYIREVKQKFRRSDPGAVADAFPNSIPPRLPPSKRLRRIPVK